MSDLFTEYVLKGIKIKNRVVLPPMVSSFGSGKSGGFAGDGHVKHYEARAKGGTGLIIVEATCVKEDGRLAGSQLGLWCDGQIEGLRKISEACHNHGAVVLIQLHHAGLKVSPEVSVEPVSSSDYHENDLSARALTIEEIHGIREDFVNAAVRARKAGFDGIELHGAHGYLLSQFMSPLVNKREDEYGGSLENRARLAVEILKSVRGKTSSDFILGYRMGGNEPTLEDGIKIAEILEKSGADLLHVSTGMDSKNPPAVPEGFDYNWIVYCGTEIKKHVNVPVIAVNGIKTPQRANALVSEGLADFAAIGKPLLVDPLWTDKAVNGGGILYCLGCKACFRFKSENLCPRYISASAV